MRDCAWMPRNFENLLASNFDVVRDCASDATPGYNCIAWAAGKKDQPWWPAKTIKGYYWPSGLPREDIGEESLPNFVKAFETEGYVQCENGDIETGYEKVAIYADKSDHPLHAARSLVKGVWSSKIGDEEDIEHLTLEALSGKEYGKPAAYLKRPIKP